MKFLLIYIVSVFFIYVAVLFFIFILWIINLSLEADEEIFRNEVWFNFQKDINKYITFLFAAYDLWVGIFWDRNKKWLYVLPLPCIGFIIKFK